MSETVSPEAPGYRPRSPQNPLQEIVEENLEELFQSWDARFRKDHGPLHPRPQIGQPLKGATWSAGSKHLVEWATSPVSRVKLPSLVQYSADGGATRMTLARDLEDTELAVDADQLPGSTQAVIFVTVSDGLQSAAAAAGPFTVAPKLPRVRILKPIDGGQAVFGLPFSLEGTGYDRQETLTDSEFKWTSDLNGDLGAGRVRTVTDLREGTHHITLTVTDSAGLKASATATLTVARATLTQTVFHRGDANDDGLLDISDGIAVLGFLFTGGAAVDCKEAADANNDGRIDISDGVYDLAFAFLGGPSPLPPGPPGSPCGPDPDPPGSAGDLGCQSYNSCR
jgi:hypothetical protein